MSENKYEKLLEELLDDESGDVRAQSRAEQIMLNSIDGNEQNVSPRSRVEAYLIAMLEKLKSGGNSSDDIAALEGRITALENADDPTDDIAALEGRITALENADDPTDDIAALEGRVEALETSIGTLNTSLENALNGGV